MEASLTEALRKATNFIRASKICVGVTDGPRKITKWENRNLSRKEKGQRSEARDLCFTLNPWSLLKEIKGHPILRKPRRMTAALKLHNVQKYYKFHEQNGHTTTEYRELKKALHKLADKRKIAGS